MKIAVPAVPEAERHLEPRVGVSADTVKRFCDHGFDVVIESGAGLASGLADDQFKESGATIGAGFAPTVDSAEIVLVVSRPQASDLASLPRGCKLVGMLAPYDDQTYFADLASAGVDSFAMELMPRISRAQYMDVLSSQANLAGYKSVIDAAASFHRALPMMMTAAGTIAPAKVLVMGAGVAGLQAVATARRMGAIVSATDVRPAVKEQVESLGGKFVMVESDETESAETSGGYAKEMSEDYKRRQAELIEKTIADQDIVICTALIPGRPAPVLVTEEMVKSMRRGSVIVDLAVERGGNCPLSELGKTVEAHGVTIIGHANYPARLATDASMLYSKNLYNFISQYVDKESGAFALDWEDELVTGTALTRDGALVHPMFETESSS